MNDDDITKTTAEPDRHDQGRLDAMTDAERHAAALSGPDARPLAPGDSSA